MSKQISNHISIIDGIIRIFFMIQLQNKKKD